MMTDLSPTAQAVLDAAYALPLKNGQPNIAAAIRVAADEVISSLSPSCEDFNEYDQGFLAAHIKYCDELFAIADELEGQ